MASLEEIPAELLLMFGDHLQQSDLFSLLRVNSRFASLFINYLCRRNSIDGNSSSLFSGLNYNQEAAVIRSLNPNPISTEISHL
jgi:hypothetical protein